MPNYKPEISITPVDAAVTFGKATINGRMYSLTDPQKYEKNKSTFKDENVAIVIGDHILPVLQENDKTSNGVNISATKAQMFNIARLPDESSSDYAQYTMSGNATATDFRDKKSIGAYMAAYGELERNEADILESPDNLFQPKPSKADTPAMYALKQATCEKRIDIDKYEHRFGANFNNDKRVFNKHDITLKMLTRLCDNLDMEAELVIRDTSSDVPNPIGRSISILLTGGDEDGQSCDESEGVSEEI